MLCALIMAGGKGTRFWPLSTEEKPKQFLKLLGKDTMIQMTVKRLEGLIPLERIFIVTGKQYVNLVKDQLPSLPRQNIIAEPIGKNTAPCIALSAFHINKIYDNATIAVIPSDHLIKDEDKFTDILSTASDFIDENNDAIVTIGIKPDRPETGYGYIRYNEIIYNRNQCEIRSVERFVEKPNIERANEYLRDGHFLWNSGMFVWKNSNILNLTSKYLNNTFDVLNEIAATNEADYNRVLEERYKEVDNVSIDYGIMEKADKIYVIPSEFGWDDVGSWAAIERYTQKDFNNNLCIGTIKSYQARNNTVVGIEKEVILVGIDDVFVVESNNALLICKKEYISRIRDIGDNIIVS